MKRSEIVVGRVYAIKHPMSSTYTTAQAAVVLDTAGYNKSNTYYSWEIAEAIPTHDKTGRGILVKYLGNKYSGKTQFTVNEVFHMKNVAKEGKFAATNAVRGVWDSQKFMLEEAYDLNRQFDVKRIKDAQELMKREVIARASVLNLADKLEFYGPDVTMPMELLSDLLAGAAWPGIMELVNEEAE